MNELYGLEAMDFLLSMYSLRGLFYESHGYAIGLHRWDLGKRSRKRICKICGRKKDFLFDFTPLSSVWNSEEEKIEYECDDHGGLNGKTLLDCCSGGYRFISPSPPRGYIWLRNRLQDLTLGSYYVVRFADSFFRYLFWWAALSFARKVPSLIPILKRMANSECES